MLMLGNEAVLSSCQLFLSISTLKIIRLSLFYYTAFSSSYLISCLRYYNLNRTCDILTPLHAGIGALSVQMIIEVVVLSVLAGPLVERRRRHLLVVLIQKGDVFAILL
jgi:hypothetical protein